MNIITISQFNDELSKLLKDYENDVEELVKETVENLGIGAKEKVESKSPSNRGNYRTNWKFKRTFNGNEKTYNVTIYQNGSTYRLTHLLEFGHITRNGTTRTRSFPHILETEYEARQKFLDEITRKIEVIQ